MTRDWPGHLEQRHGFEKSIGNFEKQDKTKNNDVIFYELRLLKPQIANCEYIRYSANSTTNKGLCI